jgi:hypothetical protein
VVLIGSLEGRNEFIHESAWTGIRDEGYMAKRKITY